MSRKFVAASSLLAVAVLTAFAQTPPQTQPKAAMPQTFLVTLDLGAKWDATKPIQQQPGFMEHMANVNKLSMDGTLLLGGPLLEDFESHKINGAIYYVKTENADAAKKVVSADPLVTNELMKIASVRAFYAAGGAWLPTPKPAAPPAGGGK